MKTSNRKPSRTAVDRMNRYLSYHADKLAAVRDMPLPKRTCRFENRWKKIFVSSTKPNGEEIAFVKWVQVTERIELDENGNDK